jgi:hypothetical protein
MISSFFPVIGPAAAFRDGGMPKTKKPSPGPDDGFCRTEL